MVPTLYEFFKLYFTLFYCISGDRETRFVTGGTVVTEQIGEINLTEIGRKNAQIKRSGGAMEGPKTNNGNVITDSKAAKAANNEIEITDKERLRLRKAAETRSIAKLLPQYRDMLKHFRGLLGQNRQQASRLQRLPTDPNAVVAEEVAAEEVVEEGVQDESPLGPHSPGNYYSDDDGQGGQDGQGQVEDDVQDFHSSLNKNKNNRLDLHEIATGGNSNWLFLYFKIGNPIAWLYMGPLIILNILLGF